MTYLRPPVRGRKRSVASVQSTAEELTARFSASAKIPKKERTQIEQEARAGGDALLELRYSRAWSPDDHPASQAEWKRLRKDFQSLLKAFQPTLRQIQDKTAKTPLRNPDNDDKGQGGARAFSDNPDMPGVKLMSSPLNL